MAAGVAAASVAVIEFSGIAANRQLANVLPAGGGFAVVDPLVHYFGGNPPISELAGRLSSGLDPSTTMIVANCSGASLAFAVAAHHRPTADVLVVSPERITDDTVRTEFAEQYGSLGADPAEVIAGTVGLSGSDLVAALEKALHELQGPLAESMGGAAAMDAVAYLLSRHCAWLRYLARSAESEPVSTGARVHVITEEDDPDLSWLYSDAGESVMTHVPVRKDDMLDSPEVRRSVAAVLQRGAEPRA